MGTRYRAIELFAGGGGLLLGTSLAGFSHERAVEWNHQACDTLRTNIALGNPLLRGTEVIEGDVRDVSWGSEFDGIDLLAGGPPCQPFSLGGLARAALDRRDMFPAFTNVLAELAPRAFICENVRGLTRASFADYYSYILMRLQHPEVAAREDETWREHYDRLCREHTDGIAADLRYEVIPTVVDAADYGVPQHRSRVIIVGFRADVRANWAFPKPTHSKASLIASKETGAYWRRHGIKPSEGMSALVLPMDTYDLQPWRTVRDAISDMPNPLVGGTEGWLQHERRAAARSYPGHTGSVLDEPSKALKAGVHGVPGGENMFVADDGSMRHYTTREAARIQGFPDLYSFEGSWTETMRQIGNAVPVELARKVAASVAQSLADADASGVQVPQLRLVGDVA
ncbi:DNA cytosine methyltransferase [Parafannyhessea umbonata]|uniref:DNA (cytosine-5-)-methyltransferase n=1 Tax=Parafannyhessea umbonata TaxID=604330 RepID=A0A1H9R584_9ACTN|nr:DNA cytosine methyltransferase [Parafannyhessea umbonata]SER67209.1 DNA (cytosine-5)-methyltransferase 1 [Parafannyhessea umbonata]